MDQNQPGYQSVLSQLAQAIIGHGAFYYIAIAAVLAVLCLSANTSFTDFPRLCRKLAQGRFLPVLVRSIVVEDDVDQLASRHLGLNGVEEADELLMPEALHTEADDPAVQHVQGGEQGGDAVPLVLPVV